jgi:hypothetical protein
VPQITHYSENRQELGKGAFRGNAGWRVSRKAAFRTKASRVRTAKTHGQRRALTLWTFVSAGENIKRRAADLREGNCALRAHAAPAVSRKNDSSGLGTADVSPSESGFITATTFLADKSQT